MNDEVEMLVVPLRRGPDGPYRACSGSAIELADGRIMYAYSHFTGGGHDHEVSDVRAVVSTDKSGSKWSEPFVIKKNDARLTTLVPNLFRVGTAAMTALKAIQHGTGTQDFLDGTSGGALGLVYTQVHGHHRDGMYFRLSRDEGDSWSADVQINQVPTYRAYCPSNDSTIVLSNGRIIVPTAVDLAFLSGSFVFYSDDEGLTWQRSMGEIVVPLKSNGWAYAATHFVEPNVVELKDKRILILGRTITGRIWKAYSEDFGATWLEAQPTELAASGSPVSLRRIPSTGDLLLVWNQATVDEMASGWARMRMSCAISKDDGETWEHFKNLESPDDVSYIEPPAMQDAYDVMGGIYAVATKRRRDTKRKPPDPKLYPHAEHAHWHVDYPSLGFTSDDRAVITYGVYGGPKSIPFEQCGSKLRILPVSWFYQ